MHHRNIFGPGGKSDAPNVRISGLELISIGYDQQLPRQVTMRTIPGDTQQESAWSKKSASDWEDYSRLANITGLAMAFSAMAIGVNPTNSFEIWQGRSLAWLHACQDRLGNVTVRTAEDW